MEMPFEAPAGQILQKQRRVSDKEREHLIQLTILHEMSIVDAARCLNIPYDNAKKIITIFRKEGRIQRIDDRRTRDMKK